MNGKDFHSVQAADLVFSLEREVGVDSREQLGDQCQCYLRIGEVIISLTSSCWSAELCFSSSTRIFVAMGFPRLHDALALATSFI